VSNSINVSTNRNDPRLSDIKEAQSGITYPDYNAPTTPTFQHDSDLSGDVSYNGEAIKSLIQTARDKKDIGAFESALWTGHSLGKELWEPHTREYMEEEADPDFDLYKAMEEDQWLPVSLINDLLNRDKLQNQTQYEQARDLYNRTNDMHEKQTEFGFLASMAQQLPIQLLDPINWPEIYLSAQMGGIPTILRIIAGATLAGGTIRAQETVIQHETLHLDEERKNDLTLFGMALGGAAYGIFGRTNTIRATGEGSMDLHVMPTEKQIKAEAKFLASGQKGQRKFADIPERDRKVDKTHWFSWSLFGRLGRSVSQTMRTLNDMTSRSGVSSVTNEESFEAAATTIKQIITSKIVANVKTIYGGRAKFNKDRVAAERQTADDWFSNTYDHAARKINDDNFKVPEDYKTSVDAFLDHRKYLKEEREKAGLSTVEGDSINRVWRYQEIARLAKEDPDKLRTMLSDSLKNHKKYKGANDTEKTEIAKFNAVLENRATIKRNWDNVDAEILELQAKHATAIEEGVLNKYELGQIQGEISLLKLKRGDILKSGQKQNTTKQTQLANADRLIEQQLDKFAGLKEATQAEAHTSALIAAEEKVLDDLIPKNMTAEEALDSNILGDLGGIAAKITDEVSGMQIRLDPAYFRSLLRVTDPVSLLKRHLETAQVSKELQKELATALKRLKQQFTIRKNAKLKAEKELSSTLQGLRKRLEKQKIAKEAITTRLPFNIKKPLATESISEQTDSAYKSLVEASSPTKSQLTDSELHRSRDFNESFLTDILERNVEQHMRNGILSNAGRIALARKFGIKNGAELKDFVNEAVGTVIEETHQALRLEHTSKGIEITSQLDQTLGRKARKLAKREGEMLEKHLKLVNNTQLTPSNPEGFMHGFKVWSQGMNMATLGGGIFATALQSEIAMVLTRGGMDVGLKAIGSSFKEMQNLIKNLPADSNLLRQLQVMGGATDVWNATNIQKFIEGEDVGNAISRSGHTAGELVSKYTYLTSITSAYRTAIASSLITDLLFNKRLLPGAITKRNRNSYTRFQFDVNRIEELQSYVTKGHPNYKKGVFELDEHGGLKDMDLTKLPQDLKEMLDNTLMNAGELEILRGDRHHLPEIWSDPDSAMYLMTQFLAYPFQAHESLMLRGWSDGDARLVVGLTFSAAFTSMLALSKEELEIKLGLRKETERRYTDDAEGYQQLGWKVFASGAYQSSLAMMVNFVSQGTTGGRVLDPYQQKHIMGALGGAPIGQANTVYQAVVQAGNDFSDVNSTGWDTKYGRAAMLLSGLPAYSFPILNKYLIEQNKDWAEGF